MSWQREGFESVFSCFIDEANVVYANDHWYDRFFARRADKARKQWSEHVRLTYFVVRDAIDHIKSNTDDSFVDDRDTRASIERLLADGADVNEEAVVGPGLGKGWTPLMVASVHGHTEAVRVLLAAGAEINMTNGDGMTALSWARRAGHEEVERVLLEHGGKEGPFE